MGEWLRPAHWAPPSMIPPSRDPRAVQKRSSDEMDAADEAEPAFKRPALAERLEAVARQDVAMSEAAAGVAICPHMQKRPWRQEDAFSDTTLWPMDDECSSTLGSGYFQELSMEKYIRISRPQDTDGAYWYKRMGPIHQGHPPPCSLHEISIQDMKLLPGKTFFYIDEMINSIKNEVKGADGEPLVFELFAAVAHAGCSGHDNWGPKFQFFQLEDLFGGPPYITGLKAFTYHDYYESSEILRATKADDKCYCLCEVVRDGQSELGWSLLIHELQPVSWETMLSANANMGKMTDDGVVERQTKLSVSEEFW
ncbi:hypothetical protein CCMA1212_008379 [Trichoderma ghanense]|uniref:Uncharacterized protein n=1 Tax=Trichoderma ghanense TaxID=65468 RepID=A0ABY2GV27_9HYPO